MDLSISIQPEITLQSIEKWNRYAKSTYDDLQSNELHLNSRLMEAGFTIHIKDKESGYGMKWLLGFDGPISLTDIKQDIRTLGRAHLWFFKEVHIYYFGTPIKWQERNGSSYYFPVEPERYSRERRDFREWFFKNETEINTAVIKSIIEGVTSVIAKIKETEEKAKEEKLEREREKERRRLEKEKERQRRRLEIEREEERRILQTKVKYAKKIKEENSYLYKFLYRLRFGCYNTEEFEDWWDKYNDEIYQETVKKLTEKIK